MVTLDPGFLFRFLSCFAQHNLVRFARQTGGGPEPHQQQRSGSRWPDECGSLCGVAFGHHFYHHRSQSYNRCNDCKRKPVAFELAHCNRWCAFDCRHERVPVLAEHRDSERFQCAQPFQLAGSFSGFNGPKNLKLALLSCSFQFGRCSSCPQVFRCFSALFRRPPMFKLHACEIQSATHTPPGQRLAWPRTLSMSLTAMVLLRAPVAFLLCTAVVSTQLLPIVCRSVPGRQS